MSDPVMDKIEQDLRAMSEESTEPTQLWKRALEISRADERASLVHPGRDSEFEPKPARGRRLFLALNTVGVAALVVLAAGVWTIAASSPSPVDETMNAARRADKIETIQTLPVPAVDQAAEMSRMAKSSDSPAAPETSRQREAIAGNTDVGTGLELQRDQRAEIADSRMNESAARESELADAAADDVSDESLAFAETDKEDMTMRAIIPEDGEVMPGLSQMAMGPEEGLVLGLGNGAMFGPVVLPAIESAHIVIEVDDIDDAFVAVSDLPDAEQDEFSSIAAATDDAPIDELTLNIAPARMEEALNSIRGIGRVVEENRARDNQFSRVNAAMNYAADQIQPQQAVIDELYLYNQMTPHERAHNRLDLDEVEQLATINSAITELSRRLQDTRRSLNLSRIRVSFRAAQDSDTIEE